MSNPNFTRPALNALRALPDKERGAVAKAATEICRRSFYATVNLAMVEKAKWELAVRAHCDAFCGSAT